MSAALTLAERAAAKMNAMVPQQVADRDDEDDDHRNTPTPDDACLYGLIGRIARAASETTEASPFAVAANALVYIGCCLGRRAYLPVGNTYHYPRLFSKHVGRSGIGRKGEAQALLHRVDMALRKLGSGYSPQVHRGGLSSREGLIFLMHDGYTEGKTEVEPIDDKRLWVVESEFSNVLHQTKRDGNTLSSALRDAWDGVTLKPATKTNRLSATDPHLCLSAAITPSELLSLMQSRELSNGFANRFLIFFSERLRKMPFPQATSQEAVDGLAKELAEVLDHLRGDGSLLDADKVRMQLAPAAGKRYAALYNGELDRRGFGPLVDGLLERRAPMLLRIAMILALTDKATTIETKHLDAALAWVNYSVESIRYIFATGRDERAHSETADHAKKIVDFLTKQAEASRTDISVKVFQGRLARERIDAAIGELLGATPPAITVEVQPRTNGPGTPTKVYRLNTANSAKSANREERRGFPVDSQPCEVSELSETRPPVASSVRTVRTVRAPSKQAQVVVGAQDSHNSHSSAETHDSGAADNVVAL